MFRSQVHSKKLLSLDFFVLVLIATRANFWSTEFRFGNSLRNGEQGSNSVGNHVSVMSTAFLSVPEETKSKSQGSGRCVF